MATVGKQFRLLELFSGTGGASLGLRRAGWAHLADWSWARAGASAPLD